MSGRVIRRIPKVCKDRMCEVFLVEVFIRNSTMNGDIVEQLFSRECSEAEKCREEDCHTKCRWLQHTKKGKDPLIDPVDLF